MKTLVDSLAKSKEAEAGQISLLKINFRMLLLNRIKKQMVKRV